MSAPPEALRLADELEDEHDPWPRLPAAAELRRLHAENQQLQAARERDNVSFKQLLAQRDALLEALRGLLSYANVLEMRLLDADGEHRAMQQARAAIKAVR